MLRQAAVVVAGLLATTPVKAQDLTLNDLWAAVRVQWGQYAAAHPEDVQVIHADVTCDSKDDYIAGRVDLDAPEGPNFVALIVTRDPVAAGQPVAFAVPFRQSDEGGGLASDPRSDPAPILSLEYFSKEDLAEHDGSGQHIDREVCPVAIKVDDRMTDAFRFFWLLERKSAAERLYFFRH